MHSWGRVAVAMLLTALIVATLSFSIATAAGIRHHVVVRIPLCAEDEGFLRGVGEFRGLGGQGGYWTRYRCVRNDRVIITPIHPSPQPIPSPTIGR